MTYVNKSATLVKGDAVVTAGETLPGTNDRSPYPPGLLIGTIIERRQGPQRGVQERHDRCPPPTCTTRRSCW